jgi:hypothetical protein
VTTIRTGTTDAHLGGPVLRAGLVALFPELRHQVSMHYAMGYCGSGVVMGMGMGTGSFLGMRLGQQMLGLAKGRTAFDDPAFQTRPLYRGKPWYLAASIRYFRWRDRQSR